VQRRFPVAALTKLHVGVLVMITSTGYLTQAAAAGGVRVVGRMVQEVDNSAGAAGDLYGLVETGVFEFDNKGGDTVGIADVGGLVYVEDEFTIRKTPGTSLAAGRLWGFEGESGKPLIDLRDSPPGAVPERTIGAPSAANATATLTAAQIVGGVITSTGATGPTLLTMPLATDLDAALPNMKIGEFIEFDIINTGTGAANDVTLQVNTGVTIVGNPTVGSLTDATIISGSGIFRLRKSAASTYVVYRRA
jgi:hypothetical protein